MRRYALAAITVVSSILLFTMEGAVQDPASWPADAPKFKAHLIGNSHIDPVWLWPWYEGMSVVQSTFRSALERMNESSDFEFTASSAQFYEWVAETDPSMLAKIRMRVQQGRWDPVGGWWVEPDVNIPDGESLVRQGLYGQLTYKRLLGRIATTAYNPDSFGHPGTLAQILHLQGMDNYCFMRPSPAEKTLPSTLFWWESPDGTRILSYRIPISYNADRDLAKQITTILDKYRPLPREFMVFYGAGDHGGGATKENIRAIEALRNDPNGPKVEFSTPDKYFAAVRSHPNTSIPVVADDLQHHSVGCYTAESDMKKWNRTTEVSLTAAEKLTSLGSFAWGANYGKDDFTAAWKRILFLQFHDSLAGTALPEHYQTTAPEGYHFAANVAEQAMYKALVKLAWQIATTDPDSQYLVVFNLQPWPVIANVEYDLQWKPGTQANVEDERDQPVPHQLIPPTTEVNDRQRLVARVSLPAFGYRQIRITKSAEAAPQPTIQATDRSLENRYLRLSIEDDGSIRLFDKTAGREVFATAGCRAIIMNDPSDTWSHGVRAYTDEIGRFANATSRLVENGPLRARLRVRSSYGSSTLTIDWLLYTDARTLEARVALDWHEHQKMLKFSFPVALTQPRATYEIPFGNIVRETNGDENPGQRWIDLSGSDASGGQRGFGVINDAKYGYSVSGSDMRISVVRGAAFANHQPKTVDPSSDPQWQDQGLQTFRMLLVPHAGTWQEAGLPRLSEEFITPVPLILQGIHSGSQTQSGSFLEVTAPNIILAAMKKSEEGNDLILRLIESQGLSGPASVKMSFANKTWTGKFRPYEIKTLRMNAKTHAIQEVNLLEQ